MDEVIWSSNLYNELKFYKEQKIPIIKPSAYEFTSEYHPIYKPGLLLHEQIKYCSRNIFYDKKIIFNPDLVSEINYNLGCHNCTPIFIGYEWISESLYLFHFNRLSLEYRILRNHFLKKRMSEDNIKNSFGSQYIVDKDIIINDFYCCLNDEYKININTIL